MPVKRIWIPMWTPSLDILFLPKLIINAVGFAVDLVVVIVLGKTSKNLTNNFLCMKKKQKKPRQLTEVFYNYLDEQNIFLKSYLSSRTEILPMSVWERNCLRGVFFLNAAVNNNIEFVYHVFHDLCLVVNFISSTCDFF